MKSFVDSNRSGVSLVELIISMSACAVLLTLSVTLLHRVLHVQKRATAAVDAQRTLWRLEATFRSDVQAASSLDDEVGAPAAHLIRLKLPNEKSIEYRREEACIERVLLTQGEVTGRERFAFSQAVEPTIVRDEQGLVTLAIYSRDIPISGSPIVFHVTARTNRNRLPATLTLLKEVSHE